MGTFEASHTQCVKAEFRLVVTAGEVNRNICIILYYDIQIMGEISNDWPARCFIYQLKMAREAERKNWVMAWMSEMIGKRDR